MPRKFMDKRFEASLKKLQNILKKEREYQGISRTEVAKRMGISRPYLSQLESENRHLYWRMFLSWCQALKVPPQSIIERWQRLLRIFSNPWTNSFNSLVFYFCLCCYPVSVLHPPVGTFLGFLPAGFGKFIRVRSCLNWPMSEVISQESSRIHRGLISEDWERAEYAQGKGKVYDWGGGRITLRPGSLFTPWSYRFWIEIANNPGAVRTIWSWNIYFPVSPLSFYRASRC